MKGSTTLAAKRHYATETRARTVAGGVPLAEVANSLGYTKKELAFAYDTLNQFQWRRVSGEVSRNEVEILQPGRTTRTLAPSWFATLRCWLSKFQLVLTPAARASTAKQR